MGAPEVEAFLTHLAVVGKVLASTQTQALSALLFLYREVLNIELPWLDNLTQAKPTQRLPTVLTAMDVKSLLARLDGVRWLMASLLYGTGMRLMECLRLRVKDVDFSMRQVFVRDGKGMKDPVTMLPESLVEPLQTHLGRVRLIHESDLTSSPITALPCPSDAGLSPDVGHTADNAGKRTPAHPPYAGCGPAPQSGKQIRGYPGQRLCVSVYSRWLDQAAYRP
jgi:site-specific recombinase XerD